jgi:PAS domain S-box-containing protein
MRLKVQLLGYLMLAVAPALVLALVGLRAWLRNPWLATAGEAAVVLICLGGFAAALGRIGELLRSLALHLEAMRGGDFSRRLRSRPGVDDAAAVVREANALGDQLREQRLGAVEAAALLRTVIGETDVALFAVDQDGAIRLANEAGARMLGHAVGELVGRDAREVGLGPLLEGAAPRTFAGTFPGGAGRWELRRRSFRERGRRHELLLLTEVSRALREEERLAWQRLVRVLGHELNNSLAPIRSIAVSLAELVADEPLPADWRLDAREGLEVIASRAASLGRFLSGYARLAQLPPPRATAVDVRSWVRRVAGLETRVAVLVTAGPDVQVLADADQLDQLLINLVKNAADAVAGTGGAVTAAWCLTGSQLEVVVEDDGPGLASDANLFVPFFTTKPGGSGIGLVLCRQIAEAHGGTVALVNRADGPGCRAVVRIPIRPFEPQD